MIRNTDRIGASEAMARTVFEHEEELVLRSDQATALFLAILVPSSAHAMRIAPPSTEASLGRGAAIERVVDQDRIDGSMKKLKGSVKETVGKVTGNRKMQSEGAREKATGKVQKAIGGFKDSVREVIGK